jgi:energy-converting hydrogenase A subunit M
MVVEPVDDKRIDDNNQLDRSARVQNNNAKAVQAKKDERKKIVPSLQNIVHNSFYDRFDTEVINPEQVKTSFTSSRLSSIDPNLEIELFGRIYTRENIEDSLSAIIDSFEEEIENGNVSEALANLKKLSPELQSSVLNALLERIGNYDSGVSGYLSGVSRDAKLLDFFKVTLADNTILGNLSREERTQMLSRVAEKQLPTLVQLGVDSAAALADISRVVFGTITEKLQVVFDDTKSITDLVSRLTQQQNITNDDLTDIQQKADKARLTIQHARLEVARLRAMGEAEQAAELESKIIVMEQAVRELSQTAESFMEKCTPEQRVIVQNIVSNVNELFQQRVIEIADYIRAQAARGVRLSLNQDVLGIVNNVLAAAGQTPLERSLFARADINNNAANSITEVILNNYDLSYQDSNLANLQITAGFIYDTIFSVVARDREERQRLREQKLADARAVEKFLEQYTERVRETQKRLDKIAYQKALSEFSNTINMYANAVQEIIKNYGKNESKLLWYKTLLETENQKRVARTIFELNKIG